MVLLASIFTVNSINKAQNIYYIFISIIACAVIYYFKDLSIALAQTDRYNAGKWKHYCHSFIFLFNRNYSDK